MKARTVAITTGGALVGAVVAWVLFHAPVYDKAGTFSIVAGVVLFAVMGALGPFVLSDWLTAKLRRFNELTAPEPFNGEDDDLLTIAEVVDVTRGHR